jgi:hypothetical protein
MEVPKNIAIMPTQIKTFVKTHVQWQAIDLKPQKIYELSGDFHFHPCLWE